MDSNADEEERPAEGNLTVIRVALGATPAHERALDEALLTALDHAARRAFDDLLRSGTYQYQSEFARKYVEGIKQARQEGRQQAALETRVAAVLVVLEARGLEVEAQARERIVSCTDLGQLKRWHRKAVIVPRVQELFEPEPGSRGSVPTSERQSQRS